MTFAEVVEKRPKETLDGGTAVAWRRSRTSLPAESCHRSEIFVSHQENPNKDLPNSFYLLPR